MSKQLVGIVAFVAGLAIGGGAVYVSGQNSTDGVAPVTAGEAADKGPAMAQVNDTTLYFADMQALAASLGVPDQMLQDPQMLAQISEPLIDAWLVMGEAKKKGVLNSAQAVQEQQIMNYSLLYGLYMEELGARVASDAKIEEAIASGEYDDLVQDEVKARHILLETEDEAKAVIKQLDEGADFATLAAEKSTGPSSRSGGDLGWFAHQMMVTPFSDKAFAMEPGTYTKEPVKTEFGYHVILVEAKRKNIEAIKPQVEGDLVMNAYRTEAKALHDAAEIDILLAGPDLQQMGMPPVEAPVEEAPMEQAPVDETPVDEAPVEDEQAPAANEG